jgi:hypothetical protein
MTLIEAAHPRHPALRSLVSHVAAGSPCVSGRIPCTSGPSTGGRPGGKRRTGLRERLRVLFRRIKTLEPRAWQARTMSCPIPTIGDHNDLVGAKERRASPKLFHRDAHRRLLTADARDIQRRRPPAGLLRQQRHHREHSATADGLVCQRHVRDVDGVSPTAIQTRTSLGCSASTRRPNRACSCSTEIVPSASAASMLGHGRSQKGACERSGSVRACLSLHTPSHRKHTASARLSKPSYIC